MNCKEILDEILQRNYQYKKTKEANINLMETALEERKGKILSLPLSDMFSMLLAVLDADIGSGIELPDEFNSSSGVYIEKDGLRISVKRKYNQKAFELTVFDINCMAHYILIDSQRLSDIKFVKREGYACTEEQKLKLLLTLCDELLNNYERFERTVNKHIEDMLFAL